MTPDERKLLNNHISMIHAINNDPSLSCNYADSEEKIRKINNELAALIGGLWKEHDISEKNAKPIIDRFDIMDL